MNNGGVISTVKNKLEKIQDLEEEWDQNHSSLTMIYVHYSLREVRKQKFIKEIDLFIEWLEQGATDSSGSPPPTLVQYDDHGEKKKRKPGSSGVLLSLRWAVEEVWNLSLRPSPVARVPEEVLILHIPLSLEPHSRRDGHMCVVEVSGCFRWCRLTWWDHIMWCFAEARWWENMWCLEEV